MPEPVVHFLLAGLALAALHFWWQARRWRRAYTQALAMYRDLLTAAPTAEKKSAAHVKAARTRADRERAKRLAVAQRLADELAARPAAPAADDPYGLVRSGWQ